LGIKPVFRGLQANFGPGHPSRIMTCRLIATRMQIVEKQDKTEEQITRDRTGGMVSHQERQHEPLMSHAMRDLLSSGWVAREAF
jgi:hypothetical protein